MTITTYEEWLNRVDADSENVSKDKDQLYQYVKEGYETFEGSSRAELTWRMARAAYKVAASAEVVKDLKKVKTYLDEAESWSKKAIELDASCGEGHLWLATVSGKVCDFLGTKERISKAKEIQHHLEEAIRLQPDEFVSYYTYGRWCFEVAGLGWMERKIASVVFGTPPEATYQDAIGQVSQSQWIETFMESQPDLDCKVCCQSQGLQDCHEVCWWSTGCYVKWRRGCPLRTWSPGNRQQVCLLSILKKSPWLILWQTQMLVTHTHSKF